MKFLFYTYFLVLCDTKSDLVSQYGYIVWYGLRSIYDLANHKYFGAGILTPNIEGVCVQCTTTP